MMIDSTNTTAPFRCVTEDQTCAQTPPVYNEQCLWAQSEAADSRQQRNTLVSVDLLVGFVYIQ